MKQKKQLVSLILCVILICALTTPAFAGNGFINLESGTFTNNQTFYNRGSFDNYGILNNKATFDTSSGKINSYGSATQTGVETTSVNKYYTVSFNTGGSGYVNPQTVIASGTATEPSPAPTRYGYSLEGWYLDTTFNTKYNFTTPITKDITLYANWTELETAEGALYVSSAPTVSTDSATGSTIYSFSGYLSSSVSAETFTMLATAGSAPSRGGVYSVVYYSGTAAIKTLSEVTAETVSRYDETNSSITTTAGSQTNNYTVNTDVPKYQIGNDYTLTVVSNLNISTGDTVYVPRRGNSGILGFYFISMDAFTVNWVATSSADYGKLSWNAVSGAANYRIMMTKGDTTPETIASETSTAFDLRACLATDFTSEGSYTISVSAMDSSGATLKTTLNSLTVSCPSSAYPVASYTAESASEDYKTIKVEFTATTAMPYSYAFMPVSGNSADYRSGCGSALSFTFDLGSELQANDELIVQTIESSSVSGSTWTVGCSAATPVKYNATTHKFGS